MTCPSCGAENRPGRRFCRACGTALAAACPNCGAANEADDRFCGECGGPLLGSVTAQPAAEGAAPGEAAPSGERRLVSVLFADLVGFTPLAEDQDPEAVRDLLTRYFDRAREVIDRYGGTTEKFIGDAVMAVWGTPTAHEDDAERAVRAALDLTREVPSLLGAGHVAEDRGVQLRAAVMTGQAAVTVGATAGSGEGMVAGDLVNTASRLQAVAPPGTVLVGEATFRGANKSIIFEPFGEQALKGKRLPVPAWRALHVVAGRGGAGRSEGLEAPFVGRGEELRLLKELLELTGREGRARLVSIVGIAGIGKSRLVDELYRYVDGIVETIYWHRGRSPAYGEGIAFWALGEMIRERAHIAETDGADESRRKLRASLEEWILDAEERGWLTPHLAHLLGLEDAPPGSQEEAFAAWRRFFERIAEHGTTVMIFEDLHWADPGLVAFVEKLTIASRSSPLLVITLARPELLDRHPTWGAGQLSFSSLRLEPLAEPLMRQLVNGVVPGIPQAAVDAIVSRAEGVPLYAIEFIRMLLDTGRLVYAGGKYDPIDDLTELAVPESLHALVAARLDSLPGEERRLLQDASVLGQTATPVAIQAVSGASPENVERRLGELSRRELLTRIDDPRSPERGQYGFVQGVVRDVAYGTLTRADRLARHLAAAKYFEGLDDDELVGVVATHYLEAYRLDPKGRTDLRGVARRALEAAAARARSLGSPAGGLGYLEQALEVAEDETDRTRLREKAGAAASEANRIDVAERYLRQAVGEWQSRGDRIGVIRSTRMLGTVLLGAGRIEEAVRLLEPLVGEAAEAPNEPEELALWAELGRAYLFKQDFEGAHRQIERTLPAAERLGLRETTLHLLVSKGWASGAVSRGQEAIALLRGTLVAARQSGHLIPESRAAMTLSALLAGEDPVAAMEVATEQLAVVRRRGLVSWASALAGNAADVAVHAGRWDWILEHYEALWRPDLPAISQGGLAGSAAIVLAARGQAAAAARIMAALEEEVARSDSPQDRDGVAYTSAVLGLLTGRADEAHRHGSGVGMMSSASGPALTAAAIGALWLGQGSDATEILERMTGLMRGRATDASLAQIRAGIAALQGRVDEAAGAFDEIADTWRRLDVRVDVALSHITRVLALGIDRPSSTAAAQEAREILTDLGASVLLDWFDRAIKPTRSAPAQVTIAG